MGKYDHITDVQFDLKLAEMFNDEIRNADSPFAMLMAISSDFYEPLKEEYNNAVLDALTPDDDDE